MPRSWLRDTDIQNGDALHCFFDLIVCHARSLDLTSQMFCQFDMLKIYDLIDFDTCIFMYKVFHKLVPLTLLNKFSMSSSKKYKNNFYVMIARTRRKQFSITITGVSLWNSLRNFVKLSSSLKFFRINVKTNFLMLILLSFKIYGICKHCIV